MKPRILIADDEELARDVLLMFLGENDACEIVAVCKSGAETLQAIETQKPDIIFLDIQMPNGTGLEVLQKIQGDKMPVVVFVTAFDEHAIEAFNLAAVDYLLKPFDRERFTKSLNRALSQVELRRENKTNSSAELYYKLFERLNLQSQNTFATRFMIRENGRVRFVNVDETEAILAADDYVELLQKGKKILLHETLSSLETRLDPQKFCRVHRSTIVNLNYVKELHPIHNGDYTIVLTNGSELRLSRNYRQNLENLLLNYRVKL
jgi:two-component system, LytTR family, response regulator